ncbi:hypothetical protein ACOSQ3_022360 [Xanthoceras sorbifolium]
MEKAQKDPSHTTEKINLYGFVYAFQVWAIEAIPLHSKKKFATGVSRTAPRILNWEVKTSPRYEALRTEIFSRRKISAFQTLKPTEEELKLSYFTGLETAAISNDPSAPDIEIGDQEDDEYCDETHNDDVAEEEQPQPKDKQAEIQEERPIGRRPSDSQDLHRKLDGLHTEVACLQTSMTALNDKVDKGFATLQTELDEMRKGVQKFIEVICKTGGSNEKFAAGTEVPESDDIFDTTYNVDDTTDLRNDEAKEEGLKPDQCLQLAIYRPPSPLPNIVSATGNQSVEALEKKAFGVRYGMRTRKCSAFVSSPYIDPTRPKKQKTRSSNPIKFEPLKPVHKEVKSEYEALKKNKKARCYVGAPMDTTHEFFKTFESATDWLDSWHIEAYLSVLRKRQLSHLTIFSQNYNLIDPTFFTTLKHIWKKLPKDEDGTIS